jgi:O-antigen/teichoic acid export membrane protein
MKLRELLRRARPWHAVLAAQLLLQLASIALLARWLGVGGYDAWLAGQVQCALLLLLFSPGLEPWLVRRLAESRAERERRALVARAGELLCASHALILLLALLGGSFDLWPGSAIVVVLAAASSVDLARRLLVAVRQGVAEHARAARLELAGDLARIAGALGGAWLTGSALGAALGALGGSVLCAQLCLPQLARAGFPLPWSAAAREARRSGPPLGSVLRDAVALACSKHATAIGRDVLPALLLAHAGRPGELALFRACSRWVELPVRFLGGLGRVLLGVRGDRSAAELRAALAPLGWKLALLFGGAALLCALSAPWVVGLLLGREVDGALGVGLWIALGVACLGFGAGLDPLALALRALREQALVNLAWLALAAVLGVLTIASGGAPAAAATTAFFAAGALAHRLGWARRGGARD